MFDLTRWLGNKSDRMWFDVIGISGRLASVLLDKGKGTRALCSSHEKTCKDDHRFKDLAAATAGSLQNSCVCGPKVRPRRSNHGTIKSRFNVLPVSAVYRFQRLKQQVRNCWRCYSRYSARRSRKDMQGTNDSGAKKQTNSSGKKTTPLLFYNMSCPLYFYYTWIFFY